MKKGKYLLGILIAILMLSFNDLQSQNRNIFWLHGLNSNSADWDHYAELFGGTNGTRQMESHNFTYADNPGINYAADNYILNINDIDRQALTNIGVGHSQGGIVLREIERGINIEKDLMLQGFITVGTPNRGAYNANSLVAGDVDKESINAYNSVAAGPATSLIPIPAIKTIATNELGYYLYEHHFNIPTVTQNIIELQVGSDYMNNLENHTSSIPIINIVGIEDHPRHWNIVGSHLTEDLYGSPLRNPIPEVANVAKLFYLGRTISLSSQAVGFAIYSFFNPIAAAYAIWKAYSATQWNRGYKWLRDAGMNYDVLIGANRWEQRQVVRDDILTSSCADQINDLEKRARSAKAQGDHREAWELEQEIDALYADDNCYASGTVNEAFLVGEESDGFIPAYDQEMDVNFQTITAEGVNHREELNTSDGSTNGRGDIMLNVFNKIWDNDQSIFYTEER